MAKLLMSIATVGVLTTGLASNFFVARDSSLAAEPKSLSEIQTAVVDAIATGLSFLSTAIGTVLPYKLPEVLPNGDIIIRYVPPPESSSPIGETPTLGQQKV